MFESVNYPLPKNIEKKVIWIDLNKTKNMSCSKILTNIGFELIRVQTIQALNEIITNDDTDGKYLIVTSGLLCG